MTAWETYIDNVLSGDIITSRWVRLACERHVQDLEHGPDRGLYFDHAEAERNIQFFERFLTHTKGRWAGQPFHLLPWQQFAVAMLFGWRRETGARRFNTFFCQVARKNGKTQLLAGLALAMLDFDGEPAAEIYFAATKRDQARLGFDEAARMVKSSPALKHRVTTLRANMHVAGSHSKAEPLSSDYNSLDGLNVHCAVLDEFHAHKDAGLFNVLKSATGARLSPLIAIITTAGFNVDGPCHQMMKGATEVLEGKKTDDALFPLVYTLDDGDDWNDPDVWVKANPSIGVTFNHDFLSRELTSSKNHGGSMVVNFRTKHMNQWVRSSATWIDDDVVVECDGGDWEPEHGAPCFGGLDLASVSDITAFSLVWPKPGGGYHVKTWYWLPSDTVDKRLSRESSHIYGQMETLPNVHLTDGNVTDYDAIRRFLTGYHLTDGVVQYDENPLATRYNIQSIAFDRFNSSQLVLNLAGDGLNLAPYGQGFVSMSTPTKEVERLMAERKLTTHNDPVWRWMVGNVVLKRDPSGNIKPDKDKSGDKIDGIVSVVMAIGQSMIESASQPESIPDDYKIRTL